MIRTRPLTVEVTRGDLIESRHRCIAVVTDSHGEVVEAWGEVDRHIYPRSAIKPLQAIPLLESGAADAFRVSGPEVALACASHMGEPMHRDTVRAWLTRLGLGADDLECGPHAPTHGPSADDMVRAGEVPDKVCNNCSGKHTGFLATALHMEEPTAGYSGAGHPVQQRLLALLSEMGGEDLSATERGVDGCGIPVLYQAVKSLTH